MKTDALIPVIEKYVSLSNSEKDLLSDFFVYREIPRNHAIIQYGDVVKEWYFLIKGCVRFYYIKENGEEATGFFFTENMFFTSFESFLTGEPSIQVFESLEACELLVLNRHRVEELYKLIPAIQEFTNKVLQERFINAQRVLDNIQRRRQIFADAKIESFDFEQGAPTHTSHIPWNNPCITK